MQLDEFIENAHYQIADGLYRVNKRLTGNDQPSGNIPFLMDIASGESSRIAFDVAVTTKSTAQGEGGGKFRIFVVDAGVDGKLGYEHEQISRIKFTVGVDRRLGYALEGLKK
jgi:hypothetical protein